MAEVQDGILNEHLASAMSKSLRIPHVVARFLVSRGVRSVSEAHRMLCGNAGDVLDPFLIKGMDAAVAWLLDIRDRHEKVFVFGDYDLDGMSAVTLMTRALAELGMESDWRLPNRFGETSARYANYQGSKILLIREYCLRGYRDFRKLRMEVFQ